MKLLLPFRSSPVLVTLALLAGSGVAPIAAHAQFYTLTNLGTLSGDAESVGVGVNDSGQVVGGSGTEGYGFQTFLSGPNGGPLTELGTLGGRYTSGQGVNDSGQVAGYSKKASDYDHAFLSAANGGPLKDLGILPGGDSSYGYGVNNSGQVVGYADTVRLGGGPDHAFLSAANGGPLKDLGTLPTDGILPGTGDSSGYGVNNSGQVAGVSDVGYREAHAFLSGSNGGPLTDLGTLGGINSTGNGVNDSGQVVGDADTASGYTHAFLSAANGGPLTDLGTLSGDDFSNALSVNNSGQVVGYSDATNGYGYYYDRAFLFSGGKMLDLNSLIAPGSGVTLTDAFGISNTGFITGTGLDSSGLTFAFLLTPAANPVPEASTTISLGLLLALGLGAIVITRRKQAAAA